MPSLSIKRVLIAGIVGLQVVTVSAILLSSYMTTEGVLLGHARDLMESVARDTIERSEKFLITAQEAADLTQRLADHNILSQENPLAMERYFFEQLNLYRQFSGIYFGGMDGSFLFVRRTGLADGPPFETKSIKFEGDLRRVAFVGRDRSFVATNPRIDAEDDYDPRKRPWFRKAVEQRGLIWTDPYIFFTSRQPGITTASPVFDTAGRLQGVVGVDIEIAEISHFLARQRIGENGSAFILNHNGDVIAFPDSEKIRQPRGNEGSGLRFTRIDELDDAPSRAAFVSLGRPANAFDLSAPVSTSFDLAGRTFHATFAPFESPNWPWLIGVYVPEDDFLGEIKRNRSHNIYMAVAIAAVACIAGFYLWRSIAHPVSLLGENARAVKRGDLAPPAVIDTRYREISQTAEAFSQMTEALRQSREVLESEVQQRTRDLQDEVAVRRLAEERAEEASRIKSSFLANMSHELRTPLNAIIGFADMMKHEFHGRLGSEKYREYVHDIHASAKLLLQLINDVLDLSRIEAGRMELNRRPLAITNLVDAVLPLVQLQAQARGIALVGDVDSSLPRLLADERRLKQVLLNLLSNAVKFTPPGGSVTVAAKRCADDGLLLRVSDTGIGMTADEIATALTSFGQVQGVFARDHEGTGLGLPLSLKLIEAHGGTLDLNSVPGEGTTATLRFPAACLQQS